jgi:hypothetical protein
MQVVAEVVVVGTTAMLVVLVVLAVEVLEEVVDHLVL